MKQILILLILGWSIGQTACADIVRGRVVDAETKEALPEAAVKMTVTKGEGHWITTTKTDSLGLFTVYADGRGTLDVTMLGYYSKTRSVLAFGDSRKDTLDIGDIELKMSAQMLKMVEVKGHARRFTVRGDTIVFNPDAFRLQEGARLDELIRQLPGVQVDDEGKLSWNGKPIRLTMDGESLFGGDDLVQKLPAEAVQDIKAYNKASDFAKRTGRDDGEEDMVLDLTIKPGFLDRWYGDATAGYQSSEYYESELSMRRLSKTDPMMVFADANNIAKQHRRHMNGWTRNWGNGFGNEQGGTVGWQHNWQRRQGAEDLKSYYNFNGGLAHDDKWNNRRDETENYFPDVAASRQNIDTYNRTHLLNPSVRANAQWRPDTLTTLTLLVTAEHKKTRQITRQTLGQEENTASGYEPTLTQHTTKQGDGHETTLRTTINWNRQLAKEGMLGGTLKVDYVDGDTDSWTERTLNDHRDGQSSLLTQQARTPTSQLTADGSIFYRFWATKQWQLQTAYRMAYSRNRSHQDFMTNGAADNANSYANRYDRTAPTLEVSSTLNVLKLQLMPAVTTRWQRETQDYRRGMLDTAAVRRRFVAEPSFKVTWKLAKMMNIEANYSLTTKLPDLLQTIGYRDDTNPLFITEGNPGLQDSHVNDFSLKYNMVLARQQVSLSTTLGYQTTDHTTIAALSYDPTTGIYTSRPENVPGGRQWTLKLNYDQGLGDLFRLQNDFTLNISQLYGYLTLLLPTQTARTLNRQSSLHPREELIVSYQKNWLKAAAGAGIDVTRLRFTASPEQNNTLWHNYFSLNVEATVGSFDFESRMSDHLYRGYTAQAMNRNCFVWNGAVTWKILKSKARLKLEFEDLLNNEDGVWHQQSAYQQITSWTDFRHHYVGLAFTYHLDAKKKE